jgi:hypothetical protein
MRLCKLHIEELHELCASQIRVIKSRRMRYTGHVARMEGKKIVVGKPGKRYK